MRKRKKPANKKNQIKPFESELPIPLKNLSSFLKLARYSAFCPLNLIFLFVPEFEKKTEQNEEKKEKKSIIRIFIVKEIKNIKKITIIHRTAFIYTYIGIPSSMNALLFRVKCIL